MMFFLLKCNASLVVLPEQGFVNVVVLLIMTIVQIRTNVTIDSITPKKGIDAFPNILCKYLR